MLSLSHLPHCKPLILSSSTPLLTGTFRREPWGYLLFPMEKGSLCSVSLSPTRQWQKSVIGTTSDDFVGISAVSSFKALSFLSADGFPLRLAGGHRALRGYEAQQSSGLARSSVIPLSLAGNDLIILLMHRGINLFQKHFLHRLIKSNRAQQSEICGKHFENAFLFLVP